MPKVGISAWVVWRETDVGSSPADRQVVGVFHPNKSAESVREIVESIHNASQYTPAELLLFFRNGSKPYPAEFTTGSVENEDGTVSQVRWQGLIHCGHDPAYFAARVDDLREVEVGMKVRLEWTMPKRPHMSFRREGSTRSRQ